MSFYTSLTGLQAATTELSVTSNNIANAGTSGFKRADANFGDIYAGYIAKKRKAQQNPWGEGATTLEWTVSSPPPFHTFEELPKVK